MTSAVRFAFALAAACAATIASAPARAQDPDVIFKKSTVWKMLTPDDKLVTYAVDDPGVDGVACYFTAPERGGAGGHEDESDASGSDHGSGLLILPYGAARPPTPVREG